MQDDDNQPITAEQQDIAATIISDLWQINDQKIANQSMEAILKKNDQRTNNLIVAKMIFDKLQPKDLTLKQFKSLFNLGSVEILGMTRLKNTPELNQYAKDLKSGNDSMNLSDIKEPEEESKQTLTEVVNALSPAKVIEKPPTPKAIEKPPTPKAIEKPLTPKLAPNVNKPNLIIDTSMQRQINQKPGMEEVKTISQQNVKNAMFDFQNRQRIAGSTIGVAQIQAKSQSKSKGTKSEVSGDSEAFESARGEEFENSQQSDESENALMKTFLTMNLKVQPQYVQNAAQYVMTFGNMQQKQQLMYKLANYDDMTYEEKQAFFKQMKNFSNVAKLGGVVDKMKAQILLDKRRQILVNQLVLKDKKSAKKMK